MAFPLKSRYLKNNITTFIRCQYPDLRKNSAPRAFSPRRGLLFLSAGLFGAGGAAGGAVARAAAAAAGAAALSDRRAQSQRDEDEDCGKDYDACGIHAKIPPIVLTSSAATHATPHCITTTPTVFSVEPNSRRIVAMAATHGV
jgi:hypothetical protein